LVVRYTRRRWRGVYDDAGEVIGTVERIVEGRWWVFVGGMFIGVVPAAEQAAALIMRERGDGGERDE
jgi:hypothetical protein